MADGMWQGVKRGQGRVAKLGASVAATKEVKLLEPNAVRNPQTIHVHTHTHTHMHKDTHSPTPTPNLEP